MSKLLSDLTATLWQFFFVIMSLAVAMPTMACEKITRDLSLGTRLLDSELTEYSSNGKLLVKEKGGLTGGNARASLICDRWTIGLEVQSSEGQRDYAGQTSAGRQLSTNSRAGDSSVGGSLYWQFTDSVQLGADVSNRHTTREIVGTSTAVGYPETYERVLAKIGTRWDIPSPFGRWTLAGSFSVFGAQSMNLILPGKDSTSLKFKDPNQWEIGIHWRKNFESNLYIDASYRYINTETSQSEYAVVTSSGIPVGVVYQPKMILIDQPFSVSIGVNF